MSRVRAETDEEVYNFEENFEQAFKVGVEALKNLEVFTPRDMVELPNKRVEVTFTLGEAEYPMLPKWRGPTQQQKLANGEEIPLIWGNWNGVLEVAIVTDRFEDTPYDYLAIKNEHNFYKSKILDALAHENELFSELNLPYYEVSEVRPGGHLPEPPDIERMDDRTVQIFNVKFQITEEAFPV